MLHLRKNKNYRMFWELRPRAFQPCIILMARNTIVFRNIRKYTKKKKRKKCVNLERRIK